MGRRPGEGSHQDAFSLLNRYRQRREDAVIDTTTTASRADSLQQWNTSRVLFLMSLSQSGDALRGTAGVRSSQCVNMVGEDAW